MDLASCVPALCMYGGGARKRAKKGAGKVSGKRDEPVYMEIKTAHRSSLGADLEFNENKDITDRLCLSALTEGPNTERILNMCRSLYLNVCAQGYLAHKKQRPPRTLQ